MKQGLLTKNEFSELTALAASGKATTEQLKRLEPYRVKRAVLFASGFGSRMMPLTINIPKPLARVQGRRIIESTLDALLAIGIDDILIVRGYLAEEFDVLLSKYPMLKFLNNPFYATTNNISSAATVIKANPSTFCNAYVFEGDLLLRNPHLLTRYQWQSNYIGVPVENTPDWCFDTENGLIKDLHKGGSNCVHMFGVSYWSLEDGEKLATDIPKAFEDKSNHQRFWDDIPCVIEKENYDIAIRKCTFDDIYEIDSYEQLCELDPRYRIEE